ncbi:MAG: PDZ domain-containing protein [Cyanobacteria bacterium M_surface_7_m2_040]|nr:PDZ domain-containing protein [Cyanobacteria bacterium M_surface_7_m2_040]
MESRSWAGAVLLGSLLWGRPALTAPATLPLDCQAALAAAQRQQQELQQQAKTLAVLLLGEIHTSVDDHAWQLGTLERLSSGRQLTLALEMIPAARQPVLDRFNRGELDVAGLLREVDWPAVWGHDPNLYLPLLHWARLRRVPLLALNAEPALVRRVRQQGLAATPAAVRGDIGEPRPASPAYRQRLEASWRGHQAMGIGSGGAADLQGFIDSQLLRDRAIAEELAAAHRRNPTSLMVALIGVGHLEGGDGVPSQLNDLGLKRQLSLRRPALPEGCAPAPQGARLGAYLESDASGVWVRQVAPGSAAAAAGLKPGDRIVALNGQGVQRAGVVIRGVRLHPDGQPLVVTVERGGQRLELKLQLPPSSDPRLAARDNGANA